MVNSDFTFFSYSCSSSFCERLRNSFTAYWEPFESPFRFMILTVAVAPVPICFFRPGTLLALVNSSLSSHVSTKKSSGKLVLSLLAFRPDPVWAGIEMSGWCFLLTSVTLLDRFF